MNRNLSGNLFSKQALTIKETSVSAMIAEYLDRRRIYNDRLNSGKVQVGKHWLTLCKEGTPDRFAIYQGRIIFIEVKQLDKKPQPNQLIRHQLLINAGALVIVADSLEDFISKFNAIV